MNRTEQRIVTALAKLVEEEEKQLAKLRLIARILSLGGGLLLGFSLSTAIQYEEGAWFWGLGAVAGFLFGIGMFYYSAAIQWPVVIRFLNAEAIRDEQADRRP